MTSEGAIKPSVSFLNECAEDVRNIFLKMGLGVMQSSQDRSKVLDKVSNELKIEKPKLVQIITSYVEIVKLFLITNDKEFNGLLEQFGFNSSFIEELPLVPNREEVQSTICKYHQTEKRNLLNLCWRIGLSLNDELVHKNLKSVIIQINLSSGKKSTYEVDIKTFHKLRYNISMILKEMTRLKETLP